MILDGRSRFTEGGQVIRRDGMTLRSERVPRLHLTRPDSHFVVPPIPRDPRPLNRAETTRAIVLVVAVVALIALAVLSFSCHARVAEQAIPLFVGR